jgi:hypothetical protein
MMKFYSEFGGDMDMWLRLHKPWRSIYMPILILFGPWARHVVLQIHVVLFIKLPLIHHEPMAFADAMRCATKLKTAMEDMNMARL